jgi:ligand-binding sensor domain-containing protein
MKYILLQILAILISSCNSQEKISKSNINDDSKEESKASQIGQYVVKGYQDSKDNLWFGTLEKGVAKYDGETLKYFTKNNGLPSNRVVGIIEDSKGNYPENNRNGCKTSCKSNIIYGL